MGILQEERPSGRIKDIKPSSDQMITFVPEGQR
jgi:hypothetical protein